MPVKKTAHPVEDPPAYVDPPVNVRRAAIYLNMSYAEFEASGLDPDTVVANKGHVFNVGDGNALITKGD